MRIKIDGQEYFHKRHPDFEAYDKITLQVVPRYKTSGLSGDEWRTSVLVQFWFKGERIISWSSNNMQNALLLLGQRFLEAHEPIAERVIVVEGTKCDQPGCDGDAAGVYALGKLYTSRGDPLDMEREPFRYYRQFCEIHLRRGDCGREDNDENYTVLTGLGPDDSRNLIEQPATFGGVIEIDDLRDLRDVVEQKSAHAPQRITPAVLDELQQAFDASTPGRWIDDNGYRILDEERECLWESKHFPASTGRDMAFCALAHEWMPALIEFARAHLQRRD